MQDICIEFSSDNAVNLMEKFTKIPEIWNFWGLLFFGAPCIQLVYGSEKAIEPVILSSE